MLCNFTPATLSQFAIQVDTAVLPALEVGVGGCGSPSSAARSFDTGKTRGQFESKSMSGRQQTLHHKPK